MKDSSEIRNSIKILKITSNWKWKTQKNILSESNQFVNIKKKVYEKEFQCVCVLKLKKEIKKTFSSLYILVNSMKQNLKRNEKIINFKRENN